MMYGETEIDKGKPNHFRVWSHSMLEMDEM